MQYDITRPFQLEGYCLMPGSYFFELDQDSPDFRLNISDANSGERVGRINILHAMPGKQETRQYNYRKIAGFSVFDDGQQRFDDQGYQDPNALLHVAVIYKLNELVGDDWPNPTPTNSGDSHTVLIFNKTLDHFVQDAEAFAQTVETQPGKRVPYDLGRCE